MSKLTRFSVSVDSTLLDRFDRQIKKDKYPTRSKAITDLIAESLVKHEWASGTEVTAAIVMVYDHQKRDLSNKLTHIQHDYHHEVVSSQHIHMDHNNCLEIVVARGKPETIQELAHKLKGTKGVKYTSLASASTGKVL
ncbi:MAG: nickel-responsive transcriptional regulator NikR [Lentisphaerae bacterium]|nr:nickel-responsive transcriptional regulator NikR [Lentisphaerota bacterium]